MRRLAAGAKASRTAIFGSLRPRDGLVFVLAGCWAAMVLAAHDYLRSPPFAEENNIAIHLARGEGFVSPMDPSPHAAPTSWSPPVYPYLMATVYRLWGIRTPAAITALMAFNAACFGAVVAGVCILGRIYFSSAAGWLAAGLLAIHPSFLFFVGDYWDTYLALALFVWILIAAEYSTGPAWTAIVGAGLGLLSLTNASYFLVYPLIVWRAVRIESPPRPGRAVGLAVAAFCLTLAPWTVRNAATFGRLTYVRGGAEFELWLGNRPGASGLVNDATVADHPYKNAAQRIVLIRIGEMEYFHRCRAMFTEQLRADPWRFLGFCALRTGYLLIGDPDPPHGAIPPFLAGSVRDGVMIEKVAVTALTAVLGLGGMFLAWRRRWRVNWIVAVGLLSVFPFVVTSVTDRYLLPLWTIFLLFGGFLISSAFGQKRA
ncbi:MAG: hypothetical protein ABSH08_16880 [Tepidisphaeraceae bacterium]|jgi:hypothetical protein